MRSNKLAVLVITLLPSLAFGQDLRYFTIQDRDEAETHFRQVDRAVFQLPKVASVLENFKDCSSIRNTTMKGAVFLVRAQCASPEKDANYVIVHISGKVQTQYPGDRTEIVKIIEAGQVSDIQVAFKFDARPLD